MEEKKNNAVEKVENIIQDKRQSDKPNDKKTPVKKSSKQAAKAKRQRIKAQKRMEKERERAHKLAEKQKAKAAAIREKNRRIAQIKAKKEQLKAERQRRRDMLKNETKKQREQRLAEEKAAKMRLKEQKAQRKQEARLQKERARAEKSRRKDNRRQKNRGTGGWLAAVISLGVCTLVLASVLTFTFLMPTATETALETGYRRSFYDTVEQVNNMDLNMSKVLATKDESARQLYLVDLAINSELAENDFQQLPLKDESKFYTTKIINQIGDYAKYLNKKIAEGQSLTEEDTANLVRLYKANAQIKTVLGRIAENMGDDYSFSSLADGESGDIIISNMNELQNLSVEYPELIYDGPFSDGQDRYEVKGIGGDEISKEQAEERFKKIFAGYALSDVRAEGYTEGVIRCINVSATADEEILFAQFSEKGGKLIMFSYAGSCNSVEIDEDVAAERAVEFAAGLGIHGMKPVWINRSNNVYTVNLAYEQDGVIVYSDLIKVRVCAQTSKVIGMEATSYYTNHTERVIESPVISKKQAQNKVSGEIDIITARLALIPVGERSERLCYEFSGTYEGSVYYVYIDAFTGRQQEMFKVIKSAEGQLLM